jgi:Class II Aldolase and Adducin N-terminal domain
MTRDFAVTCRTAETKTDKEHRREICKIGRWMYTTRGYVVASQGNLSLRLDEDRILVTPSGACKGRLASEDLLVTDLSGEVVLGAGRPSRNFSRGRTISAPGSQLERVQERFELWRETRKRCSPIHEMLWASAVGLVGEHGLNRTARALLLNYYPYFLQPNSGD